MKTNTKYFGEIEYGEDQVLTFPNGLYGFQDERKFLLLPFAGGNGTLFCLQSLTTPLLAFTLVDPFSLDPSYSPELTESELKDLVVENSQDLYFYSMCVVREPVGESTVNLRCPVAINGDTCTAVQAILEDDRYHMRHRLSDFPGQEEEPSC